MRRTGIACSASLPMRHRAGLAGPREAASAVRMAYRRRLRGWELSSRRKSGEVMEDRTSNPGRARVKGASEKSSRVFWTPLASFSGALLSERRLVVVGVHARLASSG